MNRDPKQLDSTTILLLWVAIITLLALLALILLPKKNEAPRGTYPHSAMPTNDR